MWPVFALALVAPAADDPCASKGTALFVNAAARTMYLCENGRQKEHVPVALGQGGIDKRVEGDAKLPLGEYALGAPVASKDYHLFIPVGYPTADQRRRGYTGSAIGVHGPPRAFKGPLSTTVDWTLGCMAVGTDEEIDRIAEWVRTSRVRRIVIR
jgi:murein L,D-transpeptidase YafK